MLLSNCHSRRALTNYWVKSATGLLAVLVFATMPACGSNSAAHTDAIRSVIAQDKAISADLRSSASFWEVLAGIKPDRVDGLVDAMKSIDTSRCPADFQKAYADHIRAWQGLAVAYRAGGQTAMAQQDVQATWQQVHRIAQEFGVTDAVR